MPNKLKIVYLLFIVVAGTFPLWGQIELIPNLAVQPLPIPGGDIFLPDYGIYHQFFPGFAGAPTYDPPNADPHGITNFRGITAMGYTVGTATDNKGNAYGVITDIRVYQGDYVGGEIADPTSAGWAKRARAHGTFVEI